jgi:O-antigen/teichoic acid export membrane protein
MTRKLDTSKLDTTPSRGDRARAKAYVREFVPGMVGYCVVLVLVLIFGNLDGTSPWRFVWAILPVLPLLLVLRAVSRHLRRVDEFQQHQVLQGLGIGFAVAMIAAVTVGFLGIAGLDMRLAGWIIFAAGMAGWIVGGASAAAFRR